MVVLPGPEQPAPWKVPGPPLRTRGGSYVPFLPGPPHLPWDLVENEETSLSPSWEGRTWALPWPVGH